MRSHIVARQTNQLDIALCELLVDLGQMAELCGADGREVVGVREQDAPAV